MTAVAVAAAAILSRIIVAVVVLFATKHHLAFIEIDLWCGLFFNVSCLHQ